MFWEAHPPLLNSINYTNAIITKEGREGSGGTGTMWDHFIATGLPREHMARARQTPVGKSTLLALNLSFILEGR